MVLWTGILWTNGRYTAEIVIKQITFHMVHWCLGVKDKISSFRQSRLKAIVPLPIIVLPFRVCKVIIPYFPRRASYFPRQASTCNLKWRPFLGSYQVPTFPCKMSHSAGRSL
ncbi:unnamed protein product [Cuscuta epithymum]|uniref:Uncharacterized protein n=1 Tax=Cuscuta epithymum TaxID=186058 RepID=A0AAV0FJM6_9ASTE|nr:unnamed protein product [Cuscuta epithymum]CAH9135637.1 unnamed protein product [Cuscuta epithymum]